MDCKNCGRRHNNKSYCSNKCKMIGVHVNNIGKHYNQKEHNINFGKKPWNYKKYLVIPKSTMICNYCDKKYKIGINESMSHFVKRKFCGKKCMYKSLHVNNKGNKYASGKQSELQKQNTSKIMKDIFKKGKIKPNFKMKSYEYDGIKFRSSWEVKFAKECDDNGIKWYYELHHFPIKSNNSTYIPDFYLPKEKKFVEIKGYWYDHSKEKFKLFKKEYPQINIEVISY